MDDSFWLIQCSSFQHSWVPGEILIVQFSETEGQVIREVRIELTDEPADQADDIIFGGENIPKVFDLSQNFPNPFNSQTRIRYQLPEKQKVSLIIYNLMGRQVCQLIDREIEAGYHDVLWEGQDDQGNSVGSGAYFLQIKAGNYHAIRKMLYIR
jgi:hypothetical protein